MLISSGMKNSDKKADFAVIKTGGKQYRVSAGDTVKIEKLPNVNEGDKVEFDTVLLTNQGGKVTLGTPVISAKKVSATVNKIGKSAKVIATRYKAKSNRLTRKGHRQPFVEVKIDQI